MGVLVVFINLVVFQSALSHDFSVFSTAVQLLFLYCLICVRVIVVSLCFYFVYSIGVYCNRRLALFLCLMRSMVSCEILMVLDFFAIVLCVFVWLR